MGNREVDKVDRGTRKLCVCVIEREFDEDDFYCSH